MNSLSARTSSIVLLLGVVAILLPGCVVRDGGYGYGGADYGANYYQPAGVVYGGWGPGYRVGPYRGGGYRPGFGGGGFRGGRGSPGPRPIPSIPGGGRGGGPRGGGGGPRGGGGGHGGGGHGGGGHGR